jgi:hypothetical protein
MITANLLKSVAAAAALASMLAVSGSAAARESPEPASLTGEAARKSEPGRAVVALITAARKGDRAAVRNLLLPDVVKDLDADAAGVMNLLANMADPAISEITIDIVDADHAKGRVTRREGSSSESTGMTIKRVAGVWKISL